MPTPRASRGFTLAEAMLALSILSVAVLAIVQAITAGHMQTREADHAARATTLAESLAERVLALPYHDPDHGASVPGPEPGEPDSSYFDNADDYHGYEEEPDELTDASGSAYPDAYQMFSRSVSAEYASMNVGGLGGEWPGLRVTVTVRNDRGRTWRIRRFIPDPEGSQ